MPHRCSVCKQAGHTATTCTHPDAETKRQQRAAARGRKGEEKAADRETTPPVGGDDSETGGLPLLLSSANEVERLANAETPTDPIEPEAAAAVVDISLAATHCGVAACEDTPSSSSTVVGESEEFIRPDMRKRRRSNLPDLPPNGITVPVAKRRFDEQRYRMPSEGDTIQGWNHWPARIERASTSSRRCKHCYNIRNVERKTTFFCIGCDVYLCVPHANSSEPNCFKDYHSTLLQYYYSCLVGAQEAAALESRMEAALSDSGVPPTPADSADSSGHSVPVDGMSDDHSAAHEQAGDVTE
jgi:hypothetical protein